MVDVSPAIAELRAVIVDTWPEVADNGVLEAEHANMIPWGDLALPFAVILIDQVVPADFAPMDECWHQPQVEVFYVATVRGPGDSIRGKLADLEAALLADDVDLTECQVIDIGAASTSEHLYPNGILTAKNTSARAGSLTFEILING